MAQIKDLTEKTSVVDDDVTPIDDSQDSLKSKKVKFSTIWTYVIGKFTATLNEINSVCSGNTAIATEISQICAGRTAGGTSTNDIVTVDGSQLMLNKGLTTPDINGASLANANGTQLDTLQDVTGNGVVNEVRQGLEVGNNTVTLAQSVSNHGLTKVNFGTTNDSVALNLAANFNYSEQIEILNISLSAEVTVNPSGSDSFWEGGTELNTITIHAGHGLIVTPCGAGWLVIARGKGSTT